MGYFRMLSVTQADAVRRPLPDFIRQSLPQTRDICFRGSTQGCGNIKIWLCYLLSRRWDKIPLPEYGSIKSWLSENLTDKSEDYYGYSS
jgi:hypothetical protein